MPVPTTHLPILLGPIVEALVEPFRALAEDAPDSWIIDCTLGGGGHTAALLAAMEEGALRRHRILAVDQDLGAINRARARFERELAEGRLELRHARMSELASDDGILAEGRPVLGLLADLGFSSDQVDDSDRGLSFRAEGPLDMRLDPSRGKSCREYLQTVLERELERVLREYGEERFAGRIASAIVTARRDRALPKTTTELATLVVRAIPASARHGRIHAATRTFQALRIVVNQELEELDHLLGRVIIGIKPRGRVAILSFHSLEDRAVKQAFKGSSDFTPLTKKPLEADETELGLNPRARSAKLRIAERRDAGSESVR